MGIRIFLEKFLMETGLNFNFLSKNESLLHTFRYIFRILKDNHHLNKISDDDVKKNLFFESKKELIKDTFVSFQVSKDCYLSLIELSDECNNFVHFSSKNENDWISGNLETNSKYFNSLSMIKEITEFNYNINLIED